MPLLQGTDNVFLTDDVIAAEALRLLKNNLMAARCIHRAHEQRFNGSKIGDTISVKLPFRTLAADGRTLVVQPMVDQTVPLVVNKHHHVGFKFNQIDRTLSIQQFSDRYLKSAIVQLAHKCDFAILTEAQQKFFYSSGTPGTGVSSDSFNYAKAHMEKVAVPFDGQNYAFVDPLDRADIEVDVKTLFNERFVSDMVRESYMGRLNTMGLYSTAQQPVHTVGAHAGTPLTNGAAQKGASLITDGWSATVTGLLKAGDVFTIAGIYAVNPQTYQSTGKLMQFVVTADVDSDGSGNATIPISPAINDGTNTTLDAEGNSISLAAYRNVHNAATAPTHTIPDGAAITVMGVAGTSYRQSSLWHRDAISMACIELELPESAVVAERPVDEDSGLSLLMTAGYNVGELEQTYRIDLVYALKSLYPELGHRVWSGVNG